MRIKVAPTINIDTEANISLEYIAGLRYCPGAVLWSSSHDSDAGIIAELVSLRSTKGLGEHNIPSELRRVFIG